MSTSEPIPFVDTPPAPQGGAPLPTDVAAPPTAQPAAEAPPAAAPAPENKWAAAAQNVNGPSTEQEAAQQQPTVITPLKKRGLMGAIDDIVASISGETRPELARDQHGNLYVQERTLSRGEQWARVGGTALRGATAGLAAGKGEGNQAKAAQAGIEAGDQIQQQKEHQQQTLSAQATKENMEHANATMQRLQFAKLNWDLTRQNVEASEHDIAFADGQKDRYLKAGGIDLGTAKDPNDIAHILKTDPEIVKNMIQKGQIEVVPALDGDGKRVGNTFIKMPIGFAQTMLPAGTTFHTFDQTTGKYVDHKTADPITQAELDTYNRSAALDAATFAKAKTDEDFKKAQTNASNAEVPLRQAQAVQARATAGRESAEAAKLRAQTEILKDGDPAIATLGETIARGVQTLDQIPTKNKAAVEAYLAEHHPNLDQKSVTLNNAERNRADFAGNAKHNLDIIAEKIQKRPQLLGIINGRISSGKELTGTNDEDLSAIASALDNYALAATGAHGVRAVEARKSARQALLNHFKNGKDAVLSSIETTKSSLTNLEQPGKPRGTDGNPYTYKEQSGGNTVSPSFQSGKVPGMVKPGNIDLSNRPNIDNGDGTHSSVFSMGVNIDGKEMLIPGVGDGKTFPLRKLTTQEAIKQFEKTGKNLGTFETPAASDAYAKTLHEDQERGNRAGTRTLPPPPPGQISVQLPGAQPGFIPASALAAFKAQHPDAVVEQ